MDFPQQDEVVKKRNTILARLRLGVNIFLLAAILILVYQFYRADVIARDIALTTDPTTIISLYENLTGNECLCGVGIKQRLENIIIDNPSVTKIKDINFTPLE